MPKLFDYTPDNPFQNTHVHPDYHGKDVLDTQKFALVMGTARADDFHVMAVHDYLDRVMKAGYTVLTTGNHMGVDLIANRHVLRSGGNLGIIYWQAAHLFGITSVTELKGYANNLFVCSPFLEGEEPKNKSKAMERAGEVALYGATKMFCLPGESQDASFATACKALEKEIPVGVFWYPLSKKQNVVAQSLIDLGAKKVSVGLVYSG